MGVNSGVWSGGGFSREEAESQRIVPWLDEFGGVEHGGGREIE